MCCWIPLSQVELVPARAVHIGPIANRMRVTDRAECAAFGMMPKPALRRSLASSSLAFTALVDGRPEAMMGLEVRSAIEGFGSPWMLATDAAYGHARDLIRLGPAIIAAMGDSTRHLANVVSRDNLRAIRMLRRWGFEVGGEVTMIGGVAFLTFHMER